MYRKFCMLLSVLLSGAAWAELPGVLQWEVDRDMETTYKAVYESLEESRFFVVFEPDIGRNISSFAERWGEDYNRSGLSSIRSMVFCNAWYTNQISNRDPGLLAMCPLHVTLYQQGETTHVVFVRPTHAGQGSGDAMPLLEELEVDVSKAIEAGIETAGR